MPVYEYRCGGCSRRVSILFRTITQSAGEPPVCPRCGSRDLARLMSRFAPIKSEDARLDELSDGGFDDVDEGDPRSMARWARKMKDELGEDAGPEMDEVIEQLESGELPDDDGGLGDDLDDL
ncbi:MAG: FmdB family zinc ribbon protein [Candidatus Dormibacteria bacterium]